MHKAPQIEGLWLVRKFLIGDITRYSVKQQNAHIDHEHTEQIPDELYVSGVPMKILT